MSMIRNLQLPLLIPVFPRPHADSYRNYQSLNSLAIYAKGRTRQVDLQLLAMVKDTLEYLKSTHGMQLDEKILMSGYSASADFANRFTMLHPEIVHAVAVGGTTGNLILPLEEYGGEKITFPLGIADYEKITGHEFNLEAWQDVYHYIYNGALDTNEQYFTDPRKDPTGHDRLVHALYGPNLLERFPKTSAVYHEYTDNCQIVLYTNLGHEAVFHDVVEFFRKNSGEKFVPIEPLLPATSL